MSTTPDDAEAKSKSERAEGVRRSLSGEEAPEDTVQPSGTTSGPKGEMAPEGVGESVGRRGEDASRADGKEAGREDTGTDDTSAQRPTGTSTARDATGVNPQEGPDS
jgi:hypothetical protein